MRSILLGLVLLVVGLAPLAGAQSPVCVSLNPPFLTAGQSSLTVTVTSANGFEHMGNCVARTIRVGAPGGPIAPLPVGLCSTSWVPVAPGASATKTHNFLNQLGPGLYYTDVVTRPVGGGPLVTTWVAFSILAANSPTLTEVTTCRVGQPYILDVTQAPPLSIYFAGVSYNTNTGFNVASTFVSLDMDGLLALSFPNPLPVFVNFFGVTDTTGAAPGIAVLVPNDPSLAYLPATLQVGIVDPVGNLVLTNPITTCVAP